MLDRIGDRGFFAPLAQQLRSTIERRWNSGMGAQQSIWPGGARDSESRLRKAISRLQRHEGLARRAPSDVTPRLRSLPA